MIERERAINEDLHYLFSKDKSEESTISKPNAEKTIEKADVERSYNNKKEVNSYDVRNRQMGQETVSSNRGGEANIRETNEEISVGKRGTTGRFDRPSRKEGLESNRVVSTSSIDTNTRNIMTKNGIADSKLETSSSSVIFSESMEIAVSKNKNVKREITRLEIRYRDLSNGKRMTYDEAYDYGKSKRINQTKIVDSMIHFKSYKNMNNDMRSTEVSDMHCIHIKGIRKAQTLLGTLLYMAKFQRFTLYVLHYEYVRTIINW